MGGKVMPWAVGTYDIHSKMHFPPTDGKPYLTSEELPAALERAAARAKRPRQLFPWQERTRAESEGR